MYKAHQLLLDACSRRDALYQELFGQYSGISPEGYRQLGEGTAVTAPESDAIQPEADQRLAILSYGPDPLRPYWTYLTAGLASPWVQEIPGEVSGFGYELMIKTPQPASWPAKILSSLALHIFNHAGTMSPGVKIALNGPVSVDTDSELTNLIVWYADEAPDAWYQLPSGGFGIFALIGVTEDECCFAEAIDDYGTWCVQEMLRQTGVGQITDPKRSSIMQHENIQSIIHTVKTYAENFREQA